MRRPRLVLCGGEASSSIVKDIAKWNVIELATEGSYRNVNLSVEDLTKAIVRNIRPRLLDLLEIAAYVYASDTAETRGAFPLEQTGLDGWRRRFHFVIPVRDYKFWNDNNTLAALKNCLDFVSDEDYSFEFHSRTEADSPEYFSFQDDIEWDFYGVNRVVMFSGGLDSLSGAVDALNHGEKIILVSHRPIGTIDKRQRDLVATLRKKYGNYLYHVPVQINKDRNIGREATQRTRSFLFSSLGTIVGDMCGTDGVRFYENGVLSLNLPLAHEVIGSKASRTTHPWSLHLFEELNKLILGRAFSVENPFLFDTKTDVVHRLLDNDSACLIGATCSCSHTFWKSKTQWHCGLCGQCIDRRIAVIAAGLEGYETIQDYEYDVFLGKRPEGYARNIAVNYARSAYEVNEISDTELNQRFNMELSRAVRPFSDHRQVMEKMVDMIKRHANSVINVLEGQVKQSASLFASGKLEQTCLIALLGKAEHRKPELTNFAERIHGILSDSIPKMYRSSKPKGEIELQEYAESILTSHNIILQREFPFFRWGGASTKGDWSDMLNNLLIEMKYCRKSRRPSALTHEISADITQYGDNGQRVLFVVYDPEHQVDEINLTHDIERHDGMVIRFVR